MDLQDPCDDLADWDRYPELVAEIGEDPTRWLDHDMLKQTLVRQEVDPNSEFDEMRLVEDNHKTARSGRCSALGSGASTNSTSSVSRWKSSLASSAGRATTYSTRCASAPSNSGRTASARTTFRTVRSTTATSRQSRVPSSISAPLTRCSQRTVVAMSESRRARTALGDRPDGGPFSQYIHDELLRHNVAKNHGFAEGFVPDAGAVSRGYDRNESPWMHGRRAHDIIRRVREVLGRGE